MCQLAYLLLEYAFTDHKAWVGAGWHTYTHWWYSWLILFKTILCRKQTGGNSFLPLSCVSNSKLPSTISIRLGKKWLLHWLKAIIQLNFTQEAIMVNHVECKATHWNSNGPEAGCFKHFCREEDWPYTKWPRPCQTIDMRKA